MQTVHNFKETSKTTSPMASVASSLVMGLGTLDSLALECLTAKANSAGPMAASSRVNGKITKCAVLVQRE